jgi:peptidoglycan/LPS O-acetylase OafA/YrhL
MTGGYIGVDIFFVISGYLISGIIIDQILKDKFSFLTFYERRIRRIYPALITVLITTMLLACYLFASFDL